MSRLTVKIWADQKQELPVGWKPTGEEDSWSCEYAREVDASQIRQVAYGQAIYINGEDFPVEVVV